MKRIEFLAPVEAMRGNLSGAKDLTYNGGKRAYDVTGTDAVAPDVYQKGYIGSKRSATGRKFFSLKTKSTTNLGAASRLAMAAFGGACSLAKAASKSLAIVSALQQIYFAKRQAGKIDQYMGFNNWIQTEVYPMLKTKVNHVVISEGTASVDINNPWVEGGSGTAVSVPADVLAKFNTQLSA